MTLKRILTIAHLPCTAGTFLTGYLAKLLSKEPWISGETNPMSKGSPQAYAPEDPLHHILTTNKLKWKQWEGEYKRRLEALITFYSQDESADLLVIRDHTFGEGWRFAKNPDQPLEPFLVRMLNSIGVEYSSIFTHRDPFDTWLSLNHSFPHMAKVHQAIDSYSTFYRAAWRSWKYSASDLIEIRIEDVSENEFEQQNFLRQKIFGGTGEMNDGKVPQPIKIDRRSVGSGASGRSQPRPTRMQRRSCPTSLYLEAMNSLALQQLRRELKYCDPIEWSTRIRFSCLIHDLNVKAKKLSNISKAPLTKLWATKS